MPLLGYGEDALTLHAMTSGVAELFRQLSDSTDPLKSVRFFRPSFGRRSSAPGATSASSMFGEFDGIIGTSKAVYLIEAKWTNSGELVHSELELRPEQRRRHMAFRTYLEEWRRTRQDSWQTFADRIKRSLADNTQGLVPPSAETTLARNLEYVLRKLSDCGDEVIDVLLFSRMSAEHSVPKRCGDFCMISYLAAPEEGSGFIRLLE